MCVYVYMCVCLCMGVCVCVYTHIYDSIPHSENVAVNKIGSKCSWFKAFLLFKWLLGLSPSLVN